MLARMTQRLFVQYGHVPRVGFRPWTVRVWKSVTGVQWAQSPHLCFSIVFLAIDEPFYVRTFAR